MSQTANAKPYALVPVPAGRVPPHALDAERSVLGGILLEHGENKNSALDDMLVFLQPEDFYREAHRKIFEAAIALHRKHEPVDRVTVKASLVELGALEAIGGAQFVDVLDTVVPSASNLLYYAVIVHEKALARRLIEAAHTISSQGYEGSGSVGELLDDAERRIMAVCEAKPAQGGLTAAREVVRLAYAEIERDHERGDSITGLATGLEDLDRMTAGLQAGDGVVIAARPSAGKTALGLGIAAHVTMRGSEKYGRRAAAFFSMEMPKVQLGKRLLAHEARVDLQRIRTGSVDASDWSKLGKAQGEISAAPLEIDDGRDLSVLDIRSRLRRLARKYSNRDTPLGIAVIDYLTLMKLEDSDDRLDVKIGNNAKRLKDIGGELGIPVVFLAQLNRDSVKGGGKPRKPGLHDLKESGDIEAAADVAIFIFHDAKDGALLLLEKQRNGPTGRVPVDWHPSFVRFDGKTRGRQRDWTEPAPPHTDDDAPGGLR